LKVRRRFCFEMKVQVVLFVLAVASFAFGQDQIVGGVWKYLGRFGS
jgi:hypothetical protein